jgi:Zn-dependent alcohol dehydrogenase
MDGTENVKASFQQVMEVQYKAAVITAARKPIELWEYDHIDPGAGCINIAVVRAAVITAALYLPE